ncbi:hypothetical protein [Streptomyces sp. 1331.2]|uniref:hypothetical protein n=1 Tax=Streptomyces sp. 1331.2 TaxID=1938835 RepID=UPI000BC5F00E|nr:hypothetical protein [Streptomyces sp. 1331.2]SOB83141.1 hypothetical protein SAMN06272789_3339 [Streptomyces sp. 1331.2]
MYAITSPDGDHDETIAGLHFTAGRATADELSAGALLYFRRHGYTVEQLDDDPGDQDEQDTGTGPAGDSSPAPSASKGRTTRAK